MKVLLLQLELLLQPRNTEEGVNQKEIQANLSNAFFILIFNEF